MPLCGGFVASGRKGEMAWGQNVIVRGRRRGGEWERRGGEPVRDSGAWD